jgi:hypothetical protein
VSWCEKSHFKVMLINNANAVVFNTGPYAFNSFGYSDYDFIIYANPNQNGVTLQNGASIYHARLAIRGNFTWTSGGAQTSAVLTLTGTVPATAPISANNPSSITSSRLDIQVEVNGGSGTFAPQTLSLGSVNTIEACWGIIDFAGGTGFFVPSNFVPAISATPYQFQFTGVISGDANLNPAETFGSGNSLAAFINVGPVVYGQAPMFFSSPSAYPTPNVADFFPLTLSVNTTIIPSSAGGYVAAPQRKILVITQAASGGPYTVTWAASGTPTTSAPNVAWDGGSPPVMSSAANAVDVYELVTLDGAHWYGTVISQASTVTDIEQFVALTAAYTLTSQTTLQKLFNATTAGALTVNAATSYFFECSFDLTAMSGTTGTFSFGFLGTATLTSVRYVSAAQKADAVNTAPPVTAQMVTSTQAAATVLVATSTTTTGGAVIKGIVRVNAAGTLIPATAISVATTAVVSVNSWFRLTPVGTNVVTNVGNWS